MYVAIAVITPHIIPAVLMGTVRYVTRNERKLGKGTCDLDYENDQCTKQEKRVDCRHIDGYEKHPNREDNRPTGEGGIEMETQCSIQLEIAGSYALLGRADYQEEG